MQSISPMEQSVLPLTIGLKVVVQALLGHEQKTISEKHLSCHPADISGFTGLKIYLITAICRLLTGIESQISV